MVVQLVPYVPRVPLRPRVPRVPRVHLTVSSLIRIGYRLIRVGYRYRFIDVSHSPS